MENAKLHVEGPLDSSGTSYGPSTDFFLTEEATDEAETDTKPQDIPTQDDDQSILSPIQGKRNFRWNGIANGHRLYHAGYGDDYESALIEWLIEAESLISPQQGQGYRIEDETRGEVLEPSDNTSGVLFKEFSWTYTAGEGVEAEWSIEGQLSDGLQQAESRNAYIRNEMSSRAERQADLLRASGLDDWPMGELTERRYSRSIDLNVMDMVHNSNVPTVGIAESGVQGEWMLDGRLSRNDADLKKVAREIVDDWHGKQVTFVDAFSGREIEGAISTSSTSFEAGSPNILNYRVELKVGQTAQSQS